jgi:hypothetical protein
MLIYVNAESFLWNNNYKHGAFMNKRKKERVWIIQRCIDIWKNQYENWPGYCEKQMTREEMIKALNECNEKWPYEFRGYKLKE